MNNTRVSDLFQVQERFLRSVNLERDFVDPNALAGYVLTPQAQAHLQKLLEGLHPQSGKRAWRVTGDYGAGKSSFALFLAHYVGQNNRRLATHPQFKAVKRLAGQNLRPQPLLPVLVTGSREPLSAALLRALRQEITNFFENFENQESIEILAEIEEVWKGADPLPDERVVKLISKTSRIIAETGKAAGILIILDELGKFLEYAAFNPDRQDVYVLQLLAEEAARSGRTPLFVVGLLHQGFSAYASNLSMPAQREWEKVSQRFEEIFFDQPLEQITGLVADALNLRVELIPEETRRAAQEAMRSAIDLRWFGAAAGSANLLENAERIYPIHPTALPILVKLFSRFGQNQRSLFSFLMSNESCGLREFSQTPIETGKFYRLSDLYDYTRATFGHHLGLQSYRSHWNLIESTIETISAEKSLELKILKTVGLLNLIDVQTFMATEEAIIASVADEASGITAQKVRSSIKALRNNHTLYFRGAAGGYCLWSHTSVNLETAYEEAVRALGTTPLERVSPLIRSYLETRPLVARRHYIETGNLRHFEVRFVPVEDLSGSLELDYEKTDGCIVVPLCENEEDYLAAAAFSKKAERGEDYGVLLAIPRPLNILGKLYQEVQRWEWILTNTLELNNDKFAREEADRQYTNAKQNLDKRVNSLIGIQNSSNDSELRWFYRGQMIPIRNNRELLEFLSKLCDEIYRLAPRVRNEMINRREPSPAVNGARTRLLEGIFGESDKPFLGMNPDKKPPEMAIYLSLLKDSGLHRQTERGFAVRLPADDAEDKCNFLPAFKRIEEILTGQADSRVNVADLLKELRRPPYGIRDGLSPILLAIFAVMCEQHIAFYYDGAFMREMAGLDIKLFTKVPENFEIQYCKVAGVRSELFRLMLQVLEQQFPEVIRKSGGRRQDRDGEILDIVRPLVVFAAGLPQYTLNTNRLSATAIAVRRALRNSREPAMLFFRDLPKACGFAPVSTSDGGISSAEDKDAAATLVETIKSALEELRLADVRLQQRMKRSLAGFFDISEKKESNLQQMLGARAQKIVGQVTELRLKGFCLSLEDSGLGEAEWLDALGSFVCSVPPGQWQDLDEEKFVQELGVLVGRFKRVESMFFDKLKISRGATAVRVAVTNLDGTEMDDVIFISKDEERKIADIEKDVLKLLDGTKRLGLAATARAFYKILSENEKGS